MKIIDTFPISRLPAFRVSGVFLVALLASVVMGHSAAIVADFSGGTNTTNPDGYTGAAGDGWLGGWVTRTNSASNVTVTGAIASASPLNSGGNYLSVSVQNSAGTVQTGFETRQFDGTSSGVSVTQPITYSWTFSTSDFTTGTFTFMNNVGGAPSGTGSSNTWVLQENDSVWTYKNNTTDVSTTMSVTANSVYKFTLYSDPTTYTYSFTINNITAGTTYTSASGISYRNKTGNSDGTYLGFGTFVNGGTTSTYSLDSISIVPEPGVSGMLGVAAFAGFFLKRRLRRR